MKDKLALLRKQEDEISKLKDLAAGHQTHHGASSAVSKHHAMKVCLLGNSSMAVEKNGDLSTGDEDNLLFMKKTHVRRQSEMPAQGEFLRMASNLHATEEDSIDGIKSKKTMKIRRKATKAEYMNSTLDFEGQTGKKKIRVVKRRVNRGNSEGMNPPEEDLDKISLRVPDAGEDPNTLITYQPRSKVIKRAMMEAVDTLVNISS